MFSNNLQGLTPRVSEVRKLLVPLGIGQHNAIEIFAVKWNVVSEISKVLPNNIFAEFDGSSGIKNIITYRLNLVGAQVDKISAKIMAEDTKKYIVFIKKSVETDIL